MTEFESALPGEVHIYKDDTFRYSDDDWRAIAAELPAGADASAVRADLETMLSGVRPSWRHARLGQLVPVITLGDEIKMRRKAIKAAEDFMAAYPQKLRPRGEDPKTWYALNKALKDVIDKQSDILTELTAEKRRGRPVNWFRWLVVEGVLGPWMRAGGKLGRSNSPTGPTGPTVRFLIAASTPKFTENGWPALTPAEAYDMIGKILSERRGKK
jgi:hypothetical protein